MIHHAIATDVAFVWVAADSVYRVGDIEIALRRAGKAYLLGVNSTHHFGSWARLPAVGGTAEHIARALLRSAWRGLSAGAGTKEARLHDGEERTRA